MRRYPWVSPLVLVAAAVWLGCANAASAKLIIAIPNFTFETPDVDDDNVTDSEIDLDPVPDWLFTPTAYDNMGEPTFGGIITTGVWDPVNTDYDNTTGVGAMLPGPAQGSQTAYIYLMEPGGGGRTKLEGSLTTSDPLAKVTSNTRYDLAVAVGNSKVFEPGAVRIEILVNDNVVAFATATAATLPNGAFTNVTASFTTIASDPMEGNDLRIRLVQAFSGNGTREVEFDNVRLEANPIPEPAAAALLMLSGAGAVVTRRRRGATV